MMRTGVISAVLCGFIITTSGNLYNLNKIEPENHLDFFRDYKAPQFKSYQDEKEVYEAVRKCAETQK
jgi:bifunctional DNA-binding transcriptional regulator/antitoxin component of YhaV-PrlF toxin-antitoxin module